MSDDSTCERYIQCLSLIPLLQLRDRRGEGLFFDNVHIGEKPVYRARTSTQFPYTRPWLPHICMCHASTYTAEPTPTTSLHLHNRLQPRMPQARSLRSLHRYLAVPRRWMPTARGLFQMGDAFKARREREGSLDRQMGRVVVRLWKKT